MQIYLLLFIALFALVDGHRGKKSRVIELTDTTFDTLVGKGEWVVEFYATWCGACARFAPEYETLARHLHHELPDVRVGKVDIDLNPALSSRFMVQRLPTLFHVNDRDVRSMNVPRQVSLITQYLRDEKWRDEKPWSQWLSPFSMGMRALGAVGSFTATVMAYITTIPAWGLICIGAGSLMFLAVLGRIVSPRDVATDDSKKRR